MKQIRTIDRESFAPFGNVLAFSNEDAKPFEIIVREASHGWRMAVYQPPAAPCLFLEKHPDSRESFEPIRGIALLLVATEDAPAEFETFVLDKPVCLYSGIWHNCIVLSSDALLGVTENDEVASEFYQLDRPAVPSI